ncbi:MAG: TetR/AcrR family transcriptional regulator [Eubacteriales bacterium]
MNLNKKRKREMEIQKEKRRREIIISALEIFKAKGIGSTKMTDVAKKSEYGVATVYRYFSTKSELVVEAATHLWVKEISQIKNLLEEKTFSQSTCIEKIQKILELFLDVYTNQRDLLFFLDEFDTYILKEELTGDQLKNYEKNILNLKDTVVNTLNKGIEEGTVKKNLDPELYYTTTTHSLMSLCQKLALRGKILNTDSNFRAEEQIKTLIDISVNYIKSK